MYVQINIYIYIYRERERESERDIYSYAHIIHTFNGPGESRSASLPHPQEALLQAAAASGNVYVLGPLRIDML